MRPRIFISHSAHDPADVDMLSTLEATLDEYGFDVLVDRTRLNEQTGVLWRDAIGSWLEICDGAVVLVSERARESDWVQQECAVLSHRWRRSDEKFPLMIGMIGDLDPTVLGEGFFQTVRLDDSQVVRFAQISSLPEKAVAFFTPLKESFRASPAAERRHKVLVALQSVVDLSVMQRAARSLHARPDAYSLDRDRQRGLLANHLLQAGLETAAIAIVEMIQSFKEREDLLNLLEPGWVSVEAIDRMVDAISATLDSPVLRLRTGARKTADSYLSRCEFYFSANPLKRLNPPKRHGECTPDALLEHLTAEIVDRLAIDDIDDYEAPAVALREKVTRLCSRHRIVAVLWPEPITPELLSELRARLGPIKFLILGENEITGQLAVTELPLSSDCEQAFLNDRDVARARIAPNK